jgi:cell division protein FtsL
MVTLRGNCKLSPPSFPLHVMLQCVCTINFLLYIYSCLFCAKSQMSQKKTETWGKKRETESQMYQQRFFLDLRRSTPLPPAETDHDRCKALEKEVAELKEAQKVLLSMIHTSSLVNNSSLQTELEATRKELADTKHKLLKTTEEHNDAMKQIVTLTAAVASPVPRVRKSILSSPKVNIAPQPQQSKPRDRIGKSSA